MSWTDERIEKLMKMWEGGSTASQIAEELTGVSRNAVIGKAHRLGLKARPSPVKATDKTDVPAAVVTTAAVSAPPPPAPKRIRPIEAAPQPVTPPEPVRFATPEPRPGPPERPIVASPPTAAEMAINPLVPQPRIVSVGPGGFLRQGPGDQQAPIPPAPPRRLVPAKPSADIADKTSLLELNDRICRWPMGHPGEPDFHFCGDKVNPGFPYCVDHCGRAYQAQLPRGSRRPPPPLPFGGPRVR